MFQFRIFEQENMYEIMLSWLTITLVRECFISYMQIFNFEYKLKLQKGLFNCMCWHLHTFEFKKMYNKLKNCSSLMEKFKI